MRGFGCASFYLRAVMGVLRKVWLVVLTLLTLAFLVALIVLSVKDKIDNPVWYMTEEQALELYWQDPSEYGLR